MSSPNLTVTSNLRTDGVVVAVIVIARIIMSILGIMLNLIEMTIFLSKDMRSRSGFMMAGISACNWLMNICVISESITCRLRPCSNDAWVKLIFAVAAIVYSVSMHIIIWLTAERYIRVGNGARGPAGRGTGQTCAGCGGARGRKCEAAG